MENIMKAEKQTSFDFSKLTKEDMINFWYKLENGEEVIFAYTPSTKKVHPTLFARTQLSEDSIKEISNEIIRIMN